MEPIESLSMFVISGSTRAGAGLSNSQVGLGFNEENICSVLIQSSTTRLIVNSIKAGRIYSAKV